MPGRSPAKGTHIIGSSALKSQIGCRIGARLCNVSGSPVPRRSEPSSRIHAQAPSPYGNYQETPDGRRGMLVGMRRAWPILFWANGIYYASPAPAGRPGGLRECPGRAPRMRRASLPELYRRFIYPELRYARAGRQLIFSLPPEVFTSRSLTRFLLDVSENLRRDDSGPAQLQMVPPRGAAVLTRPDPFIREIQSRFPGLNTSRLFDVERWDAEGMTTSARPGKFRFMGSPAARHRVPVCGARP